MCTQTLNIPWKMTHYIQDGKKSFEAQIVARGAVKVCIQKHIHKKLDWEDALQLSVFSFRELPAVHSKDSPFFSFNRDPLL